MELCSNGAILGQVLQPHESHLNFTLQFFIDFNLFGMSNIDLQTLQFRKKNSTSQISDTFVESPNEINLKPESVCHYEIDCMASHIINRHRIGRGDGIENPGLEEVWNQEKERRKQLNISMACKSLSQGRFKSETKSHYKFEEMFKMKLCDLVTKPAEVLNDNKPVNNIHYPAENEEGSEVYDAVDVSVHQPNDTLTHTFSDDIEKDVEETQIDEMENTLVDESIALNSSLSIHYSQVTRKYYNTHIYGNISEGHLGS